MGVFLEPQLFLSPQFHKLSLALILAIGFCFASFLGYFSNKIKVSPVLGYLIAGYLIGPYSPGFVANLEVAEQLAEIGVILMLFAVGLHFGLSDLMQVKNIAIPGAIFQLLSTLLVVTFVFVKLGWTLEAGLILGLAIGVASTVVVVRSLTDRHLLDSRDGHIAIGWLVVEDIITVFALILVPALALAVQGKAVSTMDLLFDIASLLLKFVVLVVILFTVGKKGIYYLLDKVSRVHSPELFTITVLAIAFIVAIGASVVFSTSIALGAFIAGMIIGQTRLRYYVADSIKSIRDIFSVLFFLTIGMLFNPFVFLDHPLLLAFVLGVILIVKPVTAYAITVVLKYPYKTAITVAVALAQIGEFSFILAEEANRLEILSDTGYDLVVASAIPAIAVNPFLFKLFKIGKK